MRGCPCQFNADPIQGNCEGVGGIHIIEGYYEDIKVDGMNMACRNPSLGTEKYFLLFDNENKKNQAVLLLLMMLMLLNLL